MDRKVLGVLAVAGAALAVALLARPKERYRYSGLPERCYCHECGYVLENPKAHCLHLKCPRCGARLWRHA